VPVVALLRLPPSRCGRSTVPLYLFQSVIGDNLFSLAHALTGETNCAEKERKKEGLENQ
jgi:hypothetical protein